MHTPLPSILMFLAASLLGALGQFLYKSGADAADAGLASYVLNSRILGGIACYTAVMLLFVAAFKRGGSLSVLYPVYASTFIFAALISWYAFGTPIKSINVFGMALLVAGMYCMGGNVTDYKPGERRPIASRGLSWVKAIAAWLAGHHVSPNAISVTSVGFALAAAAALVGTREAGAPFERLLWVLAAVCVQLRLLANLFDGMVALESGKASAIGELFNEVPDRISDAVILIALGFVDGSSPHLGYAAAVLAIFVAYVRAMGGTAGARQAFAGIMAKQKRMFLVTVLCLFQALVPDNLRGIGAPTLVLAAICIGCVVTAWTRLATIAADLRADR